MLTSTQARDAKPRAKQYELSCEALPGFLLRVLPSGKKVFFVRYRDSGKDVRERLGPLGPDFGVDAARRAALEVLAQRGAADEPGATSTRSSPRTPDRTEKPEVEPASQPRGARARKESPPDLDRGARSGAGARRAGTTTERVDESPAPRAPTVAEFADRFEADHIAVYLKPNTVAHYRLALRRYIVPTLGCKPLDAVTTTDVQRLHNSLRSKPSMANYVRCVLGLMFTKADQWQVTCRRNPVDAVGRFRERAVERFLTPEERARLESVLHRCETTPRCQHGHLNPEAARAIRLLALTGMRRDEVLNLTWPQIDWRQGLLRLPDSKTGKRDVVVSDETLALLREIADAKGDPRHGRVVCSRTGHKLLSLNETWRRVRQLADLHDLRLHDLRHSVASDAIMNGVPLEVVGKMLGHRNYHTTQRYAHIADTVLRDAVNKTSKTIARAASGKI